MNKIIKSIAAFTCVILLSGVAMTAYAYTMSDLEPVLIYGPATKNDDGTELSIDNISGISYTGDVSVYISPEYTRILDAVTGMPVAYEDIADGEIVYSYIGQAMMLSLPPKANSSMILCHIPADFGVPEYIKVAEGTWNSDRSIYIIKATNGRSYVVPKKCEIFPYLTKNIVRVDDITENSTCLIWKGENSAYKVMLFPKEETAPQVVEKDNNGWQKENDSWFYYDTDGNRHKGWLDDNGTWYYLDPETGIMQTGFLSLNGKIYYLNEDGSMLTTAKTFTPDSNGELH